MKINLIEINNGNMKLLEKLATEYVEKETNKHGENYITKIGLGFANDEYKNLFIKQLKKSIPKKLMDNPPKRIWVPSGSSIMLNALYEVFPKAYFLAVQTGKTIWPDMYNEKNTKLYNATLTEFFYDKAKIQPPYPTTQSYDAKAWTFVLEDGQNEDYIWNITSDYEDIKEDLDLSLLNKTDNNYNKYKDKHYEYEYCDITHINNTNPYLEVIRFYKMKQLHNIILKKLKKYNIHLKSGNKSQKDIITSNISMWVAMNLMEKQHLFDPLFPYNAKNNDVFINTLSYLGNISETKAKTIFEKLNIVNICNVYNKELYSIPIIKNYITYKFFKNNIILELHDSLTKKVLFKVNCMPKVYNKLKKLYKYNEYLNDYIFCLLLRYQTFMGNSHQFAMKTKFKDVLQLKYNIDFECFASPINVYYSKYCSLFYDIEKKFGSYGSFYLMKYHKGFYIANPPYENKMLEMMVLKFIDSCKNTSKPLSISFGLPNWGKYDIFEAMEIVKKSKFTKFIRCMKNGEVFWYDTLNNIKVKIPSHCRCVIQNEAGEKEYNLDNFNNLIETYWKN